MPIPSLVMMALVAAGTLNLNKTTRLDGTDYKDMASIVERTY